MTRLSVKKTYKLYIGGAFPRSESGRTFEADGHNVARASRKDARDAVRAARAALPRLVGMTAYNRGQVLYRLAEMMEARAADLEAACSGRAEVEAAIDRTVWYAGWADKLAQVLGSSNPVAGPYFDFTIPEPTGVVAILAPAEPPLLGLVSRMLPALVGGNTVVAVASEEPARSRRSSWPRRSRRRTSRAARQRPHGLRRRARALARRPHGRERDRPHRRRGSDGRARARWRPRTSSASSAPTPDAQSPWEIAPSSSSRPSGTRSGSEPRRSRGRVDRPGGSARRPGSVASTQTTSGRPGVVHRDVVPEHRPDVVRASTRAASTRAESRRARAKRRPSAGLDELDVDPAGRPTHVRDRDAARCRRRSRSPAARRPRRVIATGALHSTPSADVATNTAFRRATGARSRARSPRRAPSGRRRRTGSGNARKPRIAHQPSTSAMRTGGPTSPSVDRARRCDRELPAPEVDDDELAGRADRREDAHCRPRADVDGSRPGEPAVVDQPRRACRGRPSACRRGSSARRTATTACCRTRSSSCRTRCPRRASPRARRRRAPGAPSPSG